MRVIALVFKLIQKILFPFSLYVFVLKVWKKIRTLWLIGLFKNADASCRFGKIGRLLGAENISIGRSSGFDDYFYLTCWKKCEKKDVEPMIQIGNNCSFGAFNHITSAEQVVIGNNCLTGKWVTISDNNHGTTSYDDLKLPPLKRPIVVKGRVLIGDNVWIGDKVSILSGVSIGNNCVIAANSVVTKSVPSFCVVAGNPAVIVKKLGDFSK